MIQVIEAAKRKDHNEVAEILRALSQNRKKRVKKVNADAKYDNGYYDERNGCHSHSIYPQYLWVSLFFNFFFRFYYYFEKPIYKKHQSLLYWPKHLLN